MAAKKYKPTRGDEISFYHKKEKKTGTVCFIGSNGVTVWPHNVTIIGFDKKPIECEWFVGTEDMIGEVTK